MTKIGRAHPLYYILIYCQPGSAASLLSDFVAFLSSIIKLIRIIIVRVLNIHADDSSDSTTKECMSIMDSFNFVQHVSGPIWQDVPGLPINDRGMFW